MAEIPIKDLVRQNVKLGFELAGEIREDTTINNAAARPSGGFNPATGRIDEAQAETFTIKALWTTRRTQEERLRGATGEPINAAVIRVLIDIETERTRIGKTLQEFVALLSVQNTLVRVSTGQTFAIEQAVVDPTQSLLTLLVGRA